MHWKNYGLHWNPSVEGREFPPELAELESALSERGQSPAPAGLRRRVLEATRRAVLARQRWAAVRSWGMFAVGSAAAVLLCLNLSLGAANGTNFLQARTEEKQALLTELAREIQETAPELSEQEARQRALLYGASARFGVPKFSSPAPGRSLPVDF
jgi:hypothetical protein